jgi:hypothetical protein
MRAPTRTTPFPFLLNTVLLPALAAQTLVIPPTADATVDQNQPALNFGSDVELGFGKNFTSTPTFQVWFMRAYVQFDLLPIQATGRWPTRVLYRWYQHRASAAGCLDVTLHRVTAAWNEAAVTWQNKPGHDGAVVARACVGDSFANGWKQADVTALVQQWLLGAVPNHGLVLRDPSETTAGAARPGFAHSRENGTAALVPHLEVEFADRFGFGCSMRALLPMTDVTAGRPRLGESFTLGTIGLLPGSLVGMLFGTSNTSWSGGALPWSLAPLGSPGCDLNISPDTLVTAPAIAGGSWDLVIALPANTALDGATFYMQALALPPLLGLEVGNGVGVTLRR